MIDRHLSEIWLEFREWVSSGHVTRRTGGLTKFLAKSLKQIKFSSPSKANS